MITISIFAVIFVFLIIGVFIGSDKTFEEKNIEKRLKESHSIVKELKKSNFEMRDLLQLDYDIDAKPRISFTKILKTKDELYNYIINNRISEYDGKNIIYFLTNDKSDIRYGLSHKLYDITHCLNKLKEYETSKYLVAYLSIFSDYYYSDECQLYIKKELRLEKLERILE